MGGRGDPDYAQTAGLAVRAAGQGPHGTTAVVADRTGNARQGGLERGCTARQVGRYAASFLLPAPVRPVQYQPQRHADPEREREQHERNIHPQDSEHFTSLDPLSSAGLSLSSSRLPCRNPRMRQSRCDKALYLGLSSGLPLYPLETGISGVQRAQAHPELSAGLHGCAPTGTIIAATTIVCRAPI